MASTPTRNEEKKGSWLSPAASSVGGGPKVSLSRSEEFLARISKELTDEALFIAGYHLNPAPTKEKQTQDQGTQISKHVFVTKTRGTDTRSDRNRTRTKAHLLPSPREKGALPNNNLKSGGGFPTCFGAALGLLCTCPCLRCVPLEHAAKLLFDNLLNTLVLEGLLAMSSIILENPSVPEPSYSSPPSVNQDTTRNQRL